MLKNYLKVAWRNLLKNKIFSFINIVGLAVGLATCFLLILYIFDETSYDKHHKNADKIFRVALNVKAEKWAATPAPLAQGLKTDFPEVDQVSRVLKFPNVDNLLLTNKENDKKIYETLGFYVDSTFFNIFDYRLKYGDINTALNNPNSVVISEDTSLKMFGDLDPVGRVINIEIPFGNEDYTIKGVFLNSNNKSHIKANLFMSMKNSGLGAWVDQQTNWANNNLFHTYFKLHTEVDIEAFKQKLPFFFEKNAGADLKASNIKKTIFLQPMQDIYLKSNIGNEISTNGSMTYIYIFGSIAAFLLLIACINFMNLSTARSEKRAKEVGVRKVVGANKDSLIFQFLGESLLMSILSLFLSLVLIVLFLPAFNEFTHKKLTLFQHPEIGLWIVGIALLTGLLSGLYPAFYLSSFKPVTVLKGKLANNFSATAIRKSLVVFQFVISVSLILVSVVIWQQLDFIKNQDLGFKKDQQIILPFRNPGTISNYTTLKNEVLKSGRVISATAGTTYPGFQLVQDNSFYAEGKTNADPIWTSLAYVQEDYIKTLGYELLYGRDLPKISNAENDAIILNETAVKNLGYEITEAVGKNIFYEWEGTKYTLKIIGVVKDFHSKNLRETITPYGIRPLGQSQPNYFIANVAEGDLKNTVASIEKIWGKVNAETPFEYTFLDDDFQKNYEKEERTSSVIISFTLIAIFIACIGLFGLASFTTEQRKKEVGIRRVLGASVLGITRLHLRDFLKLVLIAMFIASPLSYYLGNKWLQSFAYRIEIGWQLFAIAGLMALAIALATVSFQVIKAAIANPVKNLRTE